jgi:hypothetical protein
MIFETFNIKLGLKTYEQDSMYSAVEKAADDYNNAYDLDILRGGQAVVGVRPLNSGIDFKWYAITGIPIPVYKVEFLPTTDVDDRVHRSLETHLKNQHSPTLLL